MNERLIKDSDILGARFQKLQQDFEQQLIANESLNNENQGRVQELKVCSSETVLVYLRFFKHRHSPERPLTWKPGNSERK